MSKYSFPDLSNKLVIFNGRRFKAFRVSQSTPFDGMEEDFDFVVWDGLHDAAMSAGNVDSNGTHTGVLVFSQVEIEIEPACDISSFIKNASKEQMRFFRETGLA